MKKQKPIRKPSKTHNTHYCIRSNMRGTKEKRNAGM